MYIRHTLIAWARFLWSRPQTTSHVVLVRPGGDQRSCACESGNGAGAILYVTGPTWRRATCEKDRAKERRRKQRDIASEESKAKAKNLTDTRMTLRGSPSETLQNTALPSSPLYLVPSAWHLHATRGYNGYQIAYFRIFFCARHTLRMRIPS